MKKLNDEDQGFTEDGAFDPEEAFGHDAVFDDHTLLVDYLNAMLAPHPPMNFDFGRGRYESSATANDVGYPGEHATVGDGLIHYEIERARGEAQELRRENEALKLKNARLIAKLNEAECCFDTATKQNDKLKSAIDTLENQLKISRMITKNHVEISKIITKNAKRRVADDAALVLDKIVRLKSVPAVAPVVEPVAQVIVELAAPVPDPIVLPGGATESAEELSRPEAAAVQPVSEPVYELRSEIAVPESRQHFALEVVNRTEEARPDAAQSLPVGGSLGDGLPDDQSVPERVAVTRRVPEEAGFAAGTVQAPTSVVPLPTVDVEVKRPVPERPAPAAAGEQTATQRLALKVGTTSKVMKRHDAKRPTVVRADSVPKAEQAKVMLQPPVGHPEVELKAEIPPESVVLQDGVPEADRSESVDLLQPARLDESGMEQAPVSKVVVKRQMMNYKELQNKKDGGEASTGHDIGRL